MTVILEADGFADMLERTEFMQRVSEQDKRIIDRVRRAKAESVAAERKLDRLEDRQREVTALVARRHQEVVDIKDRLVDRRQQFEGVRADKHQALVSTRDDRQDLEGHLAALEKEQAKVQARLAGTNGPVGAGPIRQGSGSMIWPVNGTFTSPFGYRWGRLHAGIDIAAPEGTPIRAADDGTVVLAAWTGGYGNYTCISHGGSLSTCYGAPVALRHVGRRVRDQGPGHRLRRQHGPLVRRPPALRGPRQRRRRTTRWATCSPAF